MRVLFMVLFFLSAGVAHADNGADDPQYEPSIQEGLGVAMSCAIVIPIIPLIGVVHCACQQRAFNAGLDPQICRDTLMGTRPMIDRGDYRFRRMADG